MMVWYVITVTDDYGTRTYGTDVEADARREYRKLRAVKVTGSRSVTLTMQAEAPSRNIARVR